MRNRHFLFTPNSRIWLITSKRALTRKGQYVSQKLAGSYSNLDGAPFNNAHDSVDIYRRSDVTGFPRHMMYEPSVNGGVHQCS